MIKTKHRLIKDDFVLDTDKNNYHPSIHESKNVRSQLPMVWDKALDFTVQDADGNKWIDLTSGIFVTNAGHSNPYVKDAIKRQIDKDLTFSFLYPTEIRRDLTKKILDVSPPHFEKVVLLSTGSEATDMAYKLIKFWSTKNKRKYIICFEGSYHGRVLSGDLISGGPNNSYWSGVKDDDLVFLKFPYDPDSKFDPSLLPPSDEIAAFMLETYQGWSCQFYPEDYIKDLYSFAKSNGCLVCFDEIQAGLYRMGSLYGYMQYGDFEPDIVCLGKAISSPLPLSVVLSTKELIDGAQKIGGTHAGNPVCCAAALANIEFLTDKGFQRGMVQKIELFEKRLKSLEKFEQVDYINACGMVGAILFKDKQRATDTVMELVRRGVMPVNTWHASIKIGPPLTISLEALNEAFDVIEETLRGV
jgi:4-aminobutyrate aminotransferase / (S)-3-amino-2-methylpropionate transaminase / 5-aminovalerate transaminase